MNARLPHPSRSVTLFGAIFLAFLACTILTAWLLIGRHRGETFQLAEDAARYEILSRHEPELARDVAMLEDFVSNEPSLIAAPSRAAAQDRFLTRVRTALSASGGNLASFAFGDAVAFGSFEQLSLTVEFSLSEAALASFLADVEGNANRIHLRSIGIWATPGQTAADGTPLLSVAAEAFVFLRPESTE